MRRRMLMGLIAFTLSTLPLVAVAAPARADNVGALLGLVNTLRAAHGAGPLAADPSLMQAAQAWSAHMAVSGLSHNPNLVSEIPGGWAKLGENAGVGGTIPIVFTAFVNSAFHLENMLDPTYNLTGIGVAASPNGSLWVTQDFEAKPGAAPATTAPPATTTPPTTRPATTVAPVTAPPRTAPPPLPTTAPPTSAPVTTAPPVTTVAPARVADTTSTTEVPPPPATTVPGRLAAASSTSRHQPAGNSLPGWAVALSLAGLAVVAAAALFATLGSRSG